jgi:hypothetical protein
MTTKTISNIYKFSIGKFYLAAIFLSFVSFGFAQEIKTELPAGIETIEQNADADKSVEPKADVKADLLKEAEAAEIVENKNDFLTASVREKSGKSFSGKDAVFAQPENKRETLDFFETGNEFGEVGSSSQTNQRDRWKIPRGSIEYGVEVGYAPNIALWLSGPKPFDTSDHQHLAASVRWGRILGTKGIVTFSYAFEFTPLSLAIGNEVENRNYTPGSTTQPQTVRETTYGFAIVPASFRFIFFPKYRLRPFIGSAVGPSYHFKPVPIPTGSKWNLLLDFQIGGQYMISETRALQFGYRYYHLSNVYLSNFNPGYNTNMIFVGYSIFRR